MSDTDIEATDAGSTEAPVTSEPTSTEAPSPDSPPASRRDTIAALIDKADAASAKPAGQESSPDSTKPSPARDETGRFAKAAAKAAKAAESVAQGALAKPGTLAPPPTVPGEKPLAPTSTDLKPPQSWKPAAREKWSSLPPEVQQEALRIDGEVRQVMQRAAQASQEAQAFRQAYAPFEGMIRAEGVEPIAAVQNLLQTAAALRSLPIWPKHQLLAQIITTHGADLDLLSKALAGQQPSPEQMQAQQQAAHRDPRLDSIAQEWEQFKQQRVQATYAQTSQKVESFGKDKPFFDDLREDMAQWHEWAAQQGKQLSVEQSYQRALSAREDLQAILAQRKEAEAVKQGSADVARAKAAGSSIRTSPTSPSTGVNPKDRRALLAANFDSMVGG